MLAASSGISQTVLSAWPRHIDVKGLRGTERRLADALNDAMDEQTVASAEVPALVRQVLLERSAVTGVRETLVFPKKARLPDRAHWESMGCGVIEEADRYVVRANPWSPTDSADDDPAAVERDIVQVYRGHRSSQARARQDMPADPFWQATLGYESYRSVGQRQAARTVITAPPGSTIIVGLSTSSGKTAVALASALRRSRGSGVSVFVVPTVVLALDLERRTAEQLKALGETGSPTGRYAYMRGLSDDDKAALREDIRTGRQRVVYAAPEAFVTGLASAVIGAAKAGVLRMIVVDEAHLVEHWGNEFRPEFQAISGLRKSAFEVSPPGSEPVTLLMSATLTGGVVETLEQLFGRPGPCHLVWASALRQEPGYYVHQVFDDTEQRQVVRDAITRLPRPMILYVTKPSEAEAWAGHLRAWGFGRVAVVTGNSKTQQRRDVLEGWRGSGVGGDAEPTRYDIVVATSAFGLGVDLDDVRTVIHACVPETIDRFYQEVGRSGRNGSPSVSYLVWTQRDLERARRLNRTTIIGTGLGWGRWQALAAAASRQGNHRLEIPLDAYPTHRTRDSQYNRLWNVRTLNLMVRAGLVSLSLPTPPDRRKDEAAEAWLARLSTFYGRVGDRLLVDIVGGGTNDRAVWQSKVGEVRTGLLANQRDAYAAMVRLLRGEACVGQILADHYRMNREGGVLSTQRVCRGCPSCRRMAQPGDNVSPGLYHWAPQPWPPLEAWPQPAVDPLQGLRRDASAVALTWRSAAERDDLAVDLIVKLARRGMSTLGGNGLSGKDLLTVQRRAGAAAAVLHDGDGDLLTTFRGPLIVVLGPGVFEHEARLLARCLGSLPTYIMTAFDSGPESRPGLRWADLATKSLPIRTALKEL
jgi:ATP-dependent DNA helicase RecQ